MRRRQLVAFFVLAYAISWVVWLTAIVFQGVFPSPLPSILTFIGSFGPSLSAILLTAFVEGRSGVRELLGRLLIWRAGLRWYLIVLLGPTAVVLFAVVLNFLLGGPTPGLSNQQIPPDLPSYLIAISLLPAFVFFLVFGGPLGEEVGWRGYALPRLQAGRSALLASLALGGLWALWHLPLFLIAGSSQSTFPFVPFVLWVVALAVLFTWVFNNTGGSLLMAVLFHAAVNFPLGLFLSPTTAQGTGVASPLLLYIGLVVIAAVAVVIMYGPAHLSHDPRYTRPPTS